MIAESDNVSASVVPHTQATHDLIVAIKVQLVCCVGKSIAHFPAL